MNGHKFLKVTGILMIIAAVFSIIAGVFVGGLGALAAGLGAASGLTFAYWAALFLTLIGGICQLIAGIKGVKHSKRSEKAGGLIVWGAIVAVFSVLSVVMNLVNGSEVFTNNYCGESAQSIFTLLVAFAGETEAGIFSRPVPDGGWKCPECGMPNGSSVFCAECGARRSAKE